MKSNTFDFYSSNPRNNSFYSQNEENNRFQKKLFNMTRTLASDTTNDSSYINRPIINFKPNMPLYDFDANNIINPSKMNYIVPVSPPPCHQVQRSYSSVYNSNSFKNYNRSNNRKDNFIYSFLPPNANFNDGFKSRFNQKKTLF
jgi:hypothetical protein